MKLSSAGQNDKPKPPATSATGDGGSSPEVQVRPGHFLTLGMIYLIIIGYWMVSAHPGEIESLTVRPEKAYYNLLVEGFQAGQLNLKTEVPPELARLPDSYYMNPIRLHSWYDGHPLDDLSYYHGKLYLYFGVTPAVVLFWPYAALTGHYLAHKDAALIFCAAGFLVSLGLLYALWRRCFAGVSFGVVLAGAVALGLASGLPMLLSRCAVYEVAISCGYAFVMLALAAVWGALAQPERQGRWLAVASAAYGLAVGARPNLLFGAVILLVPVAVAWRKRQRVWRLGLAAIGPISLIGMGLMVYNEQRFGSASEFGQDYQLGAPHYLIHHFSPDYLWFNFREYFLELAAGSGPIPAGHGLVEFPFGVLPGIPLVWLALAAPLAGRGREKEMRLLLGGMLAVMVLYFGISALTLGCYFAVCDRYEVDFIPALVLLAATGILSLERTLSGQPRWRQLARCGWVLLLAVSVGGNLFHAVERRALVHYSSGIILDSQDRAGEAIEQYREALRFNPDCAEAHYNLAGVLSRKGQTDEAILQYQEAVRLNPDYTKAQDNLGDAPANQGGMDEAIRQCQEAVRLKPDSAEAHYNLGIAFYNQGQMAGAIRECEEALRLKPDYAGARNNLGAFLLAAGRTDEAIRQFQEIIRLNPDSLGAHNNLGIALDGQGRLDEAIREYQEVIRLEPDSAEAHNSLGVALAKEGRVNEAVGQYQEALRLKPDYAKAKYNLAHALETKSATVGR